MRSGPPGETISDVQLITSKTEQNGIHLNIKMFQCFKVNAVEKKKFRIENPKPDQLIHV